MSQDLKRIGARIQQARQKQKISQAELAELLQVSSAHVSDIECGKTNCGVSIFKGIAEHLNVSADWLLQLDTPTTRVYYDNDLAELLSDCSPDECEIMLSTLQHLKKSIKFLKSKEN